jgi:NAD-dependent deacetylase
VNVDRWWGEFGYLLVSSFLPTRIAFFVGLDGSVIAGIAASETEASNPAYKCGALIRPHICWFNESPFHRRETITALKECSIFLTVGSSGVVYPAASFALTARQNGAKTYYVGLESPANASAFDEILLGPASERLPTLLEPLS